LITDAKVIKGMHVVASKIELPNGIELKDAGDHLREKLKTGVGILASTNDDKVMFVCVVTDDLIRDKKYNAGHFVKEIAKIAGGSGGGRAHLATAGANDKNKVDEALNNIFNLIQ
jgi:alanyl-tRNA synthetase